MKHKLITSYTLISVLCIGIGGVSAFSPKETARYFNGPTVQNITSKQASVSLSQQVVNDLSDEEKKNIYFEYIQADLVCPMIYPTPEYCLPKKTSMGELSVILKDLKADTPYLVTYKRDNTIRCITTPCPGNDFTSLQAEFRTKKQYANTDTAQGAHKVTSNLGFKSRGAQVTLLQEKLITLGYLDGSATGYFGIMTLKAVKEFQKANNIKPTGYVGTLTRVALTKDTVVQVSAEETFEGTVTAYSTACFADGECSITVDGKKVVTTIGWSQATVGKVTGIPDFGSIENNVGAHAKVYAKKTEDGYTLYGNEKYYVHITAKSQSKLPAGSIPSGAASLLSSNTWVWQKTLVDGINDVRPKTKDVFTLTLNEDGTLSGRTDCNSYFGGYTPGSDGVITFGEFGMTKMYCEGSEETKYLAMLKGVSRYMVDASGELVLQSGKDKVYFIKK